MLSRRDVAVFISELRRRRVFRVAVWYTAAAWGVLELATTVLPILGFGETADKVVLIAVIVAAPLTFAFAWIFDITPHGLQRTESLDAIATRRAPVVALGARSIVVLPFTDLTGTANDYFADGVTEDIIAALAGVRDLRVISRTSAMQYRRTEKPVPQIAAELGVAHVLEGSIRRAGDRVRIVAQLIDAHTDEHRWAQTYDRQLEHIFAIQSEVAQHIAQALNVQLSGAERSRIERRPTPHVDAYDAYLRGRHLWNERTEQSIRQGIASLRTALSIDAGFALAWAALAEAHVTLALYGMAAPMDVLPLARDAAERALALDPQLAAARTPLAAVRLHHEWDWAGAEAEYRRAIEGSPHYATAHHWYANHLTAAARFDDARTALERARQLDPVSPAILTSAGIISYFQRDNTRARNELDRVVTRYPTFALARMFLGLALLADEHETDAISQLQQAVDLSGGSYETRAVLACALATYGQTGDATALLKGLDTDDYVSPVLHVFVLTALGQYDDALDRLEEAVGWRAADLVWLGVRPGVDPLRSCERFDALLQPVFAGRDGLGLGAEVAGQV